MTLRGGIALLMSFAVLMAGCGGPQAASAPETRQCVALTVHPGVLGDEELKEALRSALLPLTREGGTLRVWRATRSAASLDWIVRQREVPRPRGDQSRMEDAALMTVQPLADDLLRVVKEAEATAHETRSASNKGVEEAEQVDLFGSVRKMGIEAGRMSGCGVKRGVLVSGGGINRSHELDFLDVPPSGGELSEASIAGLDLPKIVPPAGVGLEMYGAGNFDEVVPEVPTEFADAVVAVWLRVCSCIAD